MIMEILMTVSYKANMTTDDLMYILIVQLNESLDIIMSEKLLVPTFKIAVTALMTSLNYNTCLKHYPKFARAQG